MAQQMLNVGGNLPPEILQQQQALNRQQQMAQLLMQQGMNQPQGQMVSGRYVAPSFFQYAAPLAQMYAGTRLAEKGDKAMADLLRQQSERQQKIGQEFFEAVSPSQQTEMAGPYGKGVGEGGKDIPMPIAGVPDFRQAVALASDPNAPAWAKNYINEVLKPRTFKEGETFQMPSLVGGQVSFNQMGGGAPKVGQDLRDFAREAKLDINKIDNWSPADWAKVRSIESRVNESKRSVVNINQKEFDNTLKLRGDFRAEPVYKGFQEVESAYGQINKGLDAKSPAGDLAAATKFMKLLDPTSVVRESELAMAMQATGALDRLYNLANNIYTGQKLTPSQRNDFRSLAKDFYTTAYDQYSTKRGEYVGIAERNKLNIEDVVGKPPKSPAKSLSAQDQQALNWANANPNDPRSAQIKQRLGM